MTTVFNAVTSAPGIAALCIFVVGYALALSEEVIQLRKSKAVVLAAGLIWTLIGVYGYTHGVSQQVYDTIQSYILDYTGILLFVIVAMTYITVLTRLNVFEALRAWLGRKGFSYLQLFWITGFLAFCISPIADNLTAAMMIGAVVIAAGRDNPRFILLGCINTVVAANAGGAFTPFGDITTFMVWQAGVLPFLEFFKLLLPALVSFLVPAIIMSLAIPKTKPAPSSEVIVIEKGAKRVMVLFLLTIATTVVLHQYFHLPPLIGMMLGLSYLHIFSYVLKRRCKESTIDAFKAMEHLEWDTLLFFYGVILCVGGLATLGYLDISAHFLYQDLGSSLSPLYQATPANMIIGMLSAVLGNIPIMFAVLTMNPAMPETQWLLITLTAGIGGSLLSIGSAAGVALMGQSRGVYTFLSHLKWSWAILLGYLAGVGVHLLLN